jgi:hypothetical protein
MENHNDKPKDLKRSIRLLFVLFLAIVSRDALTGTIHMRWLALMGLVIICLSLSSMLLPVKNNSDVLKDQ